MDRVMLIDDSLELRRLTRFLLEFEGYRVVVTDIHDDCLPPAQSTLPEAILMNVCAHGKRTIDLVQDMRMLGGQATDTYLVMTSSGECYLEYMEAGAQPYTPEPFSPGKVIEERVPVRVTVKSLATLASW